MVVVVIAIGWVPQRDGLAGEVARLNIPRHDLFGTGIYTDELVWKGVSVTYSTHQVLIENLIL